MSRRLLLAAVVAIGCASVAPRALAAPTPEQREAVADGPAGCTRTSVRELYERFFRAAGAPAPGEALEFVASEGEQFEGGAHPVFQIGRRWDQRSRKLLASDRPGRLFGFFAGRLARGMDFSLLSLALTPLPTEEDGVGALFQLRLEAAGGGVMQAGGKGAVDCETGRFSLWQMSIVPPARTGSGCGG